MKKIAVLTLIATLNLGGAAGELIFQDGFESGWPNAWAQAAGWSAFVVKDSAGKLVGPVVGFWTHDTQQHINDDYSWYVPGSPLVAVTVGGNKIVMKIKDDQLRIGRKVFFERPGCTGQVKIPKAAVTEDPYGAVGVGLHKLQNAAYGIGPGAVVYKAEDPTMFDGSYESVTGGGPAELACSEISGDLGDDNAWPAVPIGDLDDLFTPPFTME